MQRRPVLTRRALRLALIVILGALMVGAPADRVRAELRPINPLAAESAAPPPAFAAPNVAQQSPGAFGGLFGWVLRTQQSLQRHLATGVKSLKGEHAMAGAAMLALLSFVYGVVHAVGPGHGKMVISSYVVANEETVRRGVDAFVQRTGADEIMHRAIFLGTYPGLTPAMLEYEIQVIRDFVKSR